jgi:glyoxylase-like metal-dependent hydrolase (beta-lactamase superfamily II)
MRHEYRLGSIDAAPGHPEILRIVAPNPGPMTLEGTNTYVVGRDPAYVIDPGPAIEFHVEAVRAAGEERGGIAGILLTHSHSDHTEAVAPLGAPVIDSAAGFAVVATPGHAVDHRVFVWEDACFCGDLILGMGSAIVPSKSQGGSLADYMESLERVRELGAALLCPGHGPWITDPAAKIDEYGAHRRERETKLVAALDAGERSREGLLDAAWDDVPEPLRGAAAVAMQAHLEKLDAEGRLPPGVETES